MSRRAAVKAMAAAAAALAAGCTPLRIISRDYPASFDHDHDRVDRLLRAFVSTVVPGAPDDEPGLARVYFDDFYRFSPYRSFFAADLCQRSARMFGTPDFARLDLEQRTRVVQDGLGADGTTHKLYSGAIFIAQISFYAGVYDDEKGCSLIDFPGRFRPRPLSELTYANHEEFCAAEITADGNYA